MFPPGHDVQAHAHFLFDRLWQIAYTLEPFRLGPIAQAVEQQPFKLLVAGSSPAGLI